MNVRYPIKVFLPLDSCNLVGIRRLNFTRGPDVSSATCIPDNQHCPLISDPKRANFICEGIFACNGKAPSANPDNYCVINKGSTSKAWNWREVYARDG